MLCENIKDIEGYEGHYAITTDGRVYSHSRVMNNPRSEAGSLIKGRWLKATTNKKGYLRINLSKDCKGRAFQVHRLVAEAFIPNPDNLPQVNHINGDKADNRVENLEWVSAKENVQHAIDTGLWNMESKQGSRNPASKLTEEQVLAIRADTRSSYKLASVYGMSKTTIKDIRSRKIWKHI